MTFAPVRTAMSWSISLRRSPKPGRLNRRHVDRAAQLINYQSRQGSPSTSSAMIRIGLPILATCSSIAASLSSKRFSFHSARISGFVSTDSIFSASVTK